MDAGRKKERRSKNNGVWVQKLVSIKIGRKGKRPRVKTKERMKKKGNNKREDRILTEDA